MIDDPYRIKRACEKAGVKLAGQSTHTPLVRSEIGTEYPKQFVRFAAECGVGKKRWYGSSAGVGS
jgi:hypothetical protein